AVLNLSRLQPATELPKLRSRRRFELAANVRPDRDRARTPRLLEGRDEAKAGHNRASARTSAADAGTVRPARSAAIFEQTPARVARSLQCRWGGCDPLIH